MIFKTHHGFSWWASALLAVISGALIVLSVPTFDVFFLAWVGLVPLTAAVASPGRTLKSAFACGWITGIVVHMGGFYWLDSTMVRFGNLHPALAFGIFLIFGLVSGLSYAILALMLRMMITRSVPTPVALAVSLVVVEAFFPHLFQWLLAMSHWRIPLAIQTAEIWGAAGISAVLAMVNGAVFDKIAWDTGWTVKTRRALAWTRIVAVGVCLIMVYGAVRIEMVEAVSRNLPAVKVGIVQPAISIEEKKTPSFAMRNLWLLQSFSSNLEQRGAEIIVWPETSYPFRIPRTQTRDFDGLRKISYHTTVPIVAGAVSYGNGEFFNSTYLVTEDERLVGPSDKNNLVLFGEYNPLYSIVPESLRIKYPALARRGMSPGGAPGILRHGRLSLGVLNCLEDILASYTARVVRSGANLLVNVTNDAWFGDTAEPYQHLALAVFRAVETRRTLVRSVNTGISAVVDLTGNIVAMSEPYSQDTILLDVRLSNLATPFQATGNVLGWICGAMFLLILALRRRKT